MAEETGRIDRALGGGGQPVGRRSFPALAYLRNLGPGIVAGASDNDPTSVATFAVIGGSVVYRLSWLTLLIFPMLAAILVISAEIGVLARRGLQSAVRERYGRVAGLVLLAPILVVTIITTAADVEGGGAALQLLTGVDWHWFVVPFAAAILLVLFFGDYGRIQGVLKYVLFVFVAYAAAAFFARPDWGAVARATLVPHLDLGNPAYIAGALALLGTTLTSYAHVWETIEEAEESPPRSRLPLVRFDAVVGMAFAVALFWFIEIATGATLGVHHRQVQSAQDAAKALVPVAGPVAGDLFAIGLLASAVLAVPVLAATLGYMITSELRLPNGLSRRLGEAPAFYAIISAVLLVGVAITFLGISPIQLLFVSSMAGGFGAPISIAFTMLVARDSEVMKRRPVGPLLTVAGWGTFVIVAGVSAAFLVGQLLSAIRA